MSDETNAVEETEEEVVFTGIAAKIDKKINLLTLVRDKAVKLESGLDTQASINKLSVELRTNLYGLKDDLHMLYSEVLNVKKDLISNVSEVAGANKKAALEKKIAEMQAAVAEM